MVMSWLVLFLHIMVAALSPLLLSIGPVQFPLTGGGMVGEAIIGEVGNGGMVGLGSGVLVAVGAGVSEGMAA